MGPTDFCEILLFATPLLISIRNAPNGLFNDYTHYAPNVEESRNRLAGFGSVVGDCDVSTSITDRFDKHQGRFLYWYVELVTQRFTILSHRGGHSRA